MDRYSNTNRRLTRQNVTEKVDNYNFVETKRRVQYTEEDAHYDDNRSNRYRSDRSQSSSHSRSHSTRNRYEHSRASSDHRYRDNVRVRTVHESIERPKWEDLDTRNGMPPSDYTVTSINQTHDLLRVADVNATFHMNQTSKEWLDNHGIEFLKLTLKNLLDKGTVTKPVSDKSGTAIQHITFDATDINEFEYKLNLALEMYSKRIKWLMMSSRKAFGLVQGQRVAVLVDSSTGNMNFGRAVELQDSLINLITEQLCNKKQFYFSTFGTDVKELWQDSLKDVHHRTIEEAKLFITQMKQAGGCNLLKAIKRVLPIENIDAIVIILGTVPDQNMDVIVDFTYQTILNKNISLHCVSYELNNHIVNAGLKRLAEETNGRYHCYSNSQEHLIYGSTDINILLKEIQRVQDILRRIKEMRQGMLGSAIIKIENEIQMELEKYPQAKFLPRPRGHDLPLKIEHNSSAKSSSEWLKKSGLRAKKLNLYQILAPNAYAPVEDFIPILKKTVQSTVHESAMAQFTWHDGTVKNLHVDFAALYEYQKQLANIVKLYEKRIDWLASGSRKIFGSIIEDKVVFLIDLSASNSKYLIHIQHSLRLLMEQQIANKTYFNLIGFGSIIKRWKPTVVKPTENNLQDAWKWVLDLQCDGTRNTLGAIKAALENEEERKHNIEIDGLYLFTSGIPDQPIEACCSYIEEAACGKDLKLHAILFNVDDYDSNGAIPGRWANITKTAEALRSLSHTIGNSRFHWFRETGIIESDDIKLIKQEIDRAVHFSKKAAGLVDSIRSKRSDEESEEPRYITSSQQTPKPIGPPKQTTLTMQRLLMREKENEDNKIKAIGWRPSSSKTTDTQTDSLRQRSHSVDFTQQFSTTESKQKPKSSKAATEAFYLDGKASNKGAVFRTYPNKKSVRKAVPLAAIPDKEEVLSTKEWLRKYSLLKLKLDLHKLISGPDCKHDTVNVGTVKKDISARYCAIFPSINVNGVVKHLQLRPGELKAYQEQCETILKRYVKRLQWLLTGSRKLFGTITHEKVAILIDTSGSMDDYMSELRKELAYLIWEQLFKQKVAFNFIRFSSRCDKWKDSIVEASEENCHKAVAWLATLTAYGNTCTLEAIEEAFKDESLEAIYLFTDGKPDNSTTMVLEEVRKLNKTRNISINVTSFNCEEKSANDFLRQLAWENHGRYHKSIKNDNDIHLYAHKILTEGVKDSYLSHIPDFEGDDLKRLATEIKKAKEYLRQSITFSKMYDKRDEFTDEVIIGPIRMNSVKETDTRHKDCIPVDFMR